MERAKEDVLNEIKSSSALSEDNCCPVLRTSVRVQPGDCA